MFYNKRKVYAISQEGSASSDTGKCDNVKKGETKMLAKVTIVVGVIALSVLLVTIVLHFHQQSEMKTDLGQQDLKNEALQDAMHKLEEAFIANLTYERRKLQSLKDEMNELRQDFKSDLTSEREERQSLDAEIKKLKTDFNADLLAETQTRQALEDELEKVKADFVTSMNIQQMRNSKLFNISASNGAEIDFLRNKTKEYDELGSITNPASSCEDIKNRDDSARDNLYYVKDLEGNSFQTYCDMSTAGGGWTLVASIHENNMKGRCTTGDRWSSEQGNSAAHPHGDGFWENRATHGYASAATSDDYKNSGYFAMNASDIMIWHVQNDTPFESVSASAYLKYHTATGFLRDYGGSLASLYSNHFIMRAKRFRTNVDNGPAIPIIWDTGSNEELLRLLANNVKREVDVGFVQFRAINYELNAFALCSGKKIKAGKGNVEHSCIGSTSYNIGHEHEETYCGDFASMDWMYDPQWASDPKLISSVVLIFYK